MTHYDEMTCLLFLDGQLDSVRDGQLRVHMEACADCRRLLAALERESEQFREALTEADEAIPARLIEGPERNASAWAWAVSFGLAATGLYSLWTGFIQPWQQQLDDAGFGGGNLLAVLFFGGVFWEGWTTMATMMQTLSLASLAVLALLVFRRQLRRMGWPGGGSGLNLWVMSGCLLAVLAFPATAEGAEVKRKIANYTLAEGQTLHTDLFLIGAHTARIDGTVEGDLIFFGQSLTVNGRVTGDVICFAQSLRVPGQVDGNIRAFINNIYLRGSVARNAILFAQTIELERDGRIDGSLTSFAETLTLDGRVGRALMSFSPQTILNGYIGGDARLRGKTLSIGPSAQLDGQARWRGHKEPQVDGAAKLAHELQVELEKKPPPFTTLRFYWRQALRWGAAFLLGLVLLLLTPGFFRDVLSDTHRYLPAFGFGALTLVATPVLAIVVCITIVGLPLGLSAIAMWLLVLYASQVFVAAWLGHRLLGESPGTPAILVRLALGLLVIRVLGHVPYLGGLVWFAVILWGMGAFVLAIARRSRPPVAPVLAAA